MSTKPFFLTYVKRETDVRKENWLSGHRLFESFYNFSDISPQISKKIKRFIFQSKFS